ncbi:DUF3943 domain-containing protein [Acidobacteriota bacterium]
MSVISIIADFSLSIDLISIHWILLKIQCGYPSVLWMYKKNVGIYIKKIMHQPVVLCLGLLVTLFWGNAAGEVSNKKGGIDFLQKSQDFCICPQKTSYAFNQAFDFDYYSQEKTEKTSSLSNKNKKKKKLGRAVLEFFAIISFSQIKFWKNNWSIVQDWRYELTWEDQKRKLFSLEAWKFDPNCFHYNWTHALAGGLYYNYARTNNLNKMESLVFSFAGSLYWEIIVEWRNIIAINDNVFTTFGGISIGEPWYQMGRYFNNKSGTINQILGFLNPIMKFNRWLDRKKIKNFSPDPQPGWHKFRLFVGGQNSNKSSERQNQSYFFGGFHTQIINIPEYGKPGQFGRKISDTLSSDIYFDIITGNNGIEEFHFFSRAVLFGYFKQNIQEQESGYSYYLGLGSAFTVLKKRPVDFFDGCEIWPKEGDDLQLEEPRNFRDKFSAVHIVGPVFDLLTFSGRFRLKLVLDAYLDFALVNAFAFNKYSIDHDIIGTKTTLFYYGYYYGLGTTLSSDLTIGLGNFELKGSAKCHFWDSIEGRDRFHDELTNNFNIFDSRFEYRLSLGYRFAGTPLELLVSFESIDRRGNIEDIDHKELESRFFLGLNFNF